MRSGYSKDEFLLAAAKKKPRLQSLVDRVGLMSIEDIQALDESLWVKEALDILRRTNGIGQKERIKQIVDRSVEAEQNARSLPKPTYEIRIWNGPPKFIGKNRDATQHEWKIEVQNNDSFMIIDDYQVRFGDSIIRIDESNKATLLHESKLVGYMTLENYRGFHRALLNQKHDI